jgi:hypothetical protein
MYIRLKQAWDGLKHFINTTCNGRIWSHHHKLHKQAIIYWKSKQMIAPTRLKSDQTRRRQFLPFQQCPIFPTYIADHPLPLAKRKKHIESKSLWVFLVRNMWTIQATQHVHFCKDIKNFKPWNTNNRQGSYKMQNFKREVLMSSRIHDLFNNKACILCEK